MTTVDIYTEKFFKLLVGLPSKSKVSFNTALRSVLTDSRYRDLPEKFLAGFVEILAIPVSEAIAETHGSEIDKLKLRYCRTDPDFRRLQNELKIKLMGPPPCTPQGEALVAKVAALMCKKHSFLTTQQRMGAAVTNYQNKKIFSPIQILSWWQLV